MNLDHKEQRLKKLLEENIREGKNWDSNCDYRVLGSRKNIFLE